MTLNPASEKQLHWITKLVDEKDIPAEMRDEIKKGLKRMDIDKKAASVYLDLLFGAKNIPVEGAVTEVGFYAHEGQVYRVKKAKTTGNLYAQRVTSSGFAYEKGMVGQLKANELMSVEDICAYGLQTGVCANCSTLLTDPISIFIGLGTKCGPTLMGKEAYNAAKHNAKADPTTAAAIAAKEALKMEVA